MKGLQWKILRLNDENLSLYRMRKTLYQDMKDEECLDMLLKKQYEDIVKRCGNKKQK